MKVTVHDLKGKEKRKIELPEPFSGRVRPDLIKRAVLSEQSIKRQKYGADPLAGQRSSAHYHGRRQIRHSMMNREMARMKRIHNQGFLNMTARVGSEVVKGRKAHPPKTEKKWEKKINRKELKKAIYSALAASADGKMVSKRHRIKDMNLPVVFEDGFEAIKKTGDVRNLLLSIGLGEELERCSEKKIRSGRGKTRGRKFKKKKGPLIIISDDKGIMKAAKGIPGLDVSNVSGLTAELVAPGTHPGRMTIWSESAVKELGRKVKGNAKKEAK